MLNFMLSHLQQKERKKEITTNNNRTTITASRGAQTRATPEHRQDAPPPSFIILTQLIYEGLKHLKRLRLNPYFKVESR